MSGRSSLSRRAFLGGAGVVLGLPLLDAMAPRTVSAGPVAVPKRLLAFYVPCGIHMRAWTPTAFGSSFDLSPILAPLAKVKSKINVLTGLQNLLARPDGPGDHASGTGSFLTCQHPFKTSGSGIKNGVSVDQVAAAALKKFTRVPSMQIGIDGGDGIGDCDSGYSCAYARNISWQSATQPLDKTTSPNVVFDQIFAGFDAKAAASERARRLAYKTSVLDYVLDDANRLSGKLGKTDQRKLSEYMDGVRALEKRLSAPAPTCDQPPAPGTVTDYRQQVKLMSDLMVLAFKCDATRAISFMLGNAGSNRTYPFLGIDQGHHQISHHDDNPVNFDMLQKIDTWEIQQLAYLLEQMDAVTEANGMTILDNSLVFFSSEIEDGNSHAHYNLPVVLAGRAGGAIAGGRHLAAPKLPLANMFVSMLNALDVPTTSFGDSTGPLSAL